MPYSDFKLEEVVSQFNLTLRDADLFAPLTPIEPSDWLTQTLSFTRTLGRRSDTEKSRSDFRRFSIGFVRGSNNRLI